MPVLDRRGDADLRRILHQGNTEAVELLLGSRHRDSLACRTVGDFATAEEVVQDRFITSWRESDRYRTERGSVRSWVLGVVRKRAMDALRGRLRYERPALAAGLHDRRPAEQREERASA